jgi:hypothetical protein
MQVLADELKTIGAHSTIIAADLSKGGAAAAWRGTLKRRV